MPDLRRACALLLASTLSCQPTTPSSQPSEETGAEPIAWPVTADGDALVFPPPPTRRARRDLPPGFAAVEAKGPPFVESPELDHTSHFEIAGKTVRIEFDRSVRPIEDSDEPSLTITPKVAGTVQWRSPWTLAFVADDDFDPEQVYSIALGPIEDEAGMAIEPWTATFRADPQVILAGKVLSYVPEPGKPRVVAVRPYDDTKVGRRAELEVLFDQPIGLGDARDLVTLTESDGSTEIPSRVSHPRRDVFDGIRVDRKHVIVVRPRRRPKPGTTLALRARDHGEDIDDADRIDVTIADPLRFKEVDCGYYSDRCDIEDGRLTMSGHNFTLEFNNTIVGDKKRLKQALQLDPPIRNLSIYSDTWSSEGSLHVSGQFAPSTTYRLHVEGLRDRFGGKLRDPVDLEIRTKPLSASVAMPEGVLYLDADHSKKFAITTRNVKRAVLHLWRVDDTASGWQTAQEGLGAREAPDAKADIDIPIEPKARENKSVATEVDLLAHTEPGRTYRASLELLETAFDAEQPDYPEYSYADRPPAALLTVTDDDALAVHARTAGDATLVQVARLSTGKPLAGARFFLDGVRVEGVASDKSGFAHLPVPASTAATKVLRVEVGDDRAELSLGRNVQHDSDLTPELSAGADGAKSLIRAMVISDRGAYRPGAVMHFKATLRHEVGGRLAPVAHLPVRLRVIAPTGKDALVETGMTNAMGSFAADYTTPATAEIGRYRTVVEPLLDPHALASTTTQVAEFEPPRFTVDVKAGADRDTMHARVEGRYLFGAAMDEAPVSWTLRRERARVPDGAFAAAGLRFRGRSGLPPWTRTGSGSLTDGTLAFDQALEVDPDAGPQRFMLEAEVTDASHRAIAGRNSVVVHPADAYAGLKVADTWVDEGKPIEVKLGVVDQTGDALGGRAVEVDLVELDWKRTRRPGPGGSVRIDWHETRHRVDRCRATSARTVVACEVTPPRPGSYELVARTGGRASGVIRVWAWGSGWTPDEPTEGHRLDVQANAKSYAVGDTARVIARNPFSSAMAILTVENGTVVREQTRRVGAGPVTFEVPIDDGFAPHVHATVTLLPIGAKGAKRADWRFGAVRLPVSLADKRLQVAVDSDHDHYEPGHEAEVTVEVRSASGPVENAEVALAVVDEGVLRLTNFHAADPVDALYVGAGLRYQIADTRHSLATLLERSHVGGDGAGSGEQSLVSTRKNFLTTVLWKPDLRTDADGRVTAQVKLPDNLTTFRMMAVVLDDEGRGGQTEASFEVRKPMMAVPAVPRFAAVGDRYEAAVMVHNNEADSQRVTVTLGTEQKTVEIPGGKGRRVAFERTASTPGTDTLVFVVEDAEGRERDRVEAKIPVQAPGIDERPRLAGSFVHAQEISMEVPAGVFADVRGDEHVTITLGQNMWPELGARLEYLIDYPHGCVEQTTSSTLPLLAAREILPRLGFTRFSRSQIDTYIEAGLKRLASMQTPSGGLAYWPGDREPNVYGTAYAIRAVALAHADGISVPPGLLEGMTEYLQGHLRAGSSASGRDAEVQASIALGLSEAQALPASHADMLFETAEHQGTFGLANLALALSTLDGEDDRVRQLLDQVESSFDPHGTLLREGPRDDFYYYGSTQRTRAQAVMALSRLRPASTALPQLVDAIIDQTGSYTTQATAFGLLALREQVLRAPEPDGAMRVLLDGVVLAPDVTASADLGGGALRYRVPMSELAGRRALLRLESSGSRAVAFLVDAQWRRPLQDAAGLAETAAERGPEVYRVYTDPTGAPVDLSTVQPGQVLRVALLARLPVHTLQRDRLGYLALTDRLPAGFEPVQPDLWTVSRAPDLEPIHPLYDLLRWGSADASHVELRDDRVHLYFDRLWDEFVAGTYLVRATTPGTYAVPPAMGELMYEPDSTGYSDHDMVTVKR